MMFRILSHFPLSGGKVKANSKAFTLAAPELQYTLGCDNIKSYEGPGQEPGQGIMIIHFLMKQIRTYCLQCTNGQRHKL